MNISSKHAVTMLGVGAVVAVVLVPFGLPLTTVLLFSVILACPLIMLAMMFMMGDKGMTHGMNHHQVTKVKDSTHVQP